MHAATDVVIIGGGHNGLAMSRMLSARGVDHVVLERGAAGQAWRSERWDSLRLLTPNWLCRLPGQPYDGPDPDGYLGASEVAEFLARYAARIDAPLHGGTSVLRVSADFADAPASPPASRCARYRVDTDRGTWRCRAVVLATGACSVPLVPAFAAGVPPAVAQWTPQSYRNPRQLGAGGALVVGASATGLQLAAEIAASGRRVLLACGEHVRMPRLYRGRDIQWWMLQSGLLDQRIESVDDPQRARRLPSPQLVGSAEHTTLDLNRVQADGVELCGRLAAVRDGRALFSGSLHNVCTLADLKLDRLLDGFDAWATQQGLDDHVGAASREAPTRVPARPRLAAEFGREIETIVWATGFRPDHRWLALPVFDRRGALRHDRGVVVDAPGLVVLGLPFLRRRKSSFIHGAEDDVRELSVPLLDHLGARVPRRAAVC